jgi:hypothetical protein
VVQQELSLRRAAPAALQFLVHYQSPAAAAALMAAAAAAQAKQFLVLRPAIQVVAVKVAAEQVRQATAAEALPVMVDLDIIFLEHSTVEVEVEVAQLLFKQLLGLFL